MERTLSIKFYDEDGVPWPKPDPGQQDLDQYKRDLITIRRRKRDMQHQVSSKGIRKWPIMYRGPMQEERPLPFLKFPPEIRRMTYKFLVEDAAQTYRVSSEESISGAIKAITSLKTISRTVHEEIVDVSRRKEAQGIIYVNNDEVRLNQILGSRVLVYGGKLKIIGTEHLPSSIFKEPDPRYLARLLDVPRFCVKERDWDEFRQEVEPYLKHSKELGDEVYELWQLINTWLGFIEKRSAVETTYRRVMLLKQGRERDDPIELD
ncbi:MAG: hypothetical protein Q9170_005828 [Blastenia crenularia]